MAKAWDDVQAQIERCRRLARSIADEPARAELERLARELEQQAEQAAAPVSGQERD